MHNGGLAQPFTLCCARALNQPQYMHHQEVFLQTEVPEVLIYSEQPSSAAARYSRPTQSTAPVLTTSLFLKACHQPTSGGYQHVPRRRTRTSIPYTHVPLHYPQRHVLFLQESSRECTQTAIHESASRPPLTHQMSPS